MKLKPSEIKLNPDNPRLIKDDKYAKLVESLKSFPEMADVREVVVNKDHVILGGNMRFKAMQEAGWKEIPVKVVDWPEAKQKEFIIKDNASFGEWEWDVLANQYELEDLEAWGVDLPEYLNADEEVEEDDAPEVDESEPPVSKLGEIYQLGRHRVMCGDSTDRANVELLMNGEKADMVFTDPPYGMDLDTDYSGIKGTSNSIGASRKILGKKYDKVIGDDKEYDPSVLLEIFSEVKEIFMWGGDYYSKLLPAGGWFVWDKCVTEGGVVSEGAENMIGSTFELCWSKVKHKRMIVRIFQRGFAGGDSEKVHPTQKPIKLSTWFIDKFSEKDQLVADLFLGSGSTLIACEQTDRTCYGMELDPKYVDVIRKRYAKFTNNNELPEGWEELTPMIRE